MGKKVLLIVDKTEMLSLSERELHLILAFRAPDCQRSKPDLRILSVAGGREDDSGMMCSA